MNALDPLLHPIVARCDGTDRLVQADPRFLDLIAQAGGAIGGDVALPEIAALVRLARRLGIAIARAVVVADGDDDLELSVRAEPDADGVTLVVGGWQARPSWRPSAERASFRAVEADWMWESDAALRLTHVTPDAGARYGFDAAAILGQPLVKLFALAEDDDGAFPILGAVAAQMRFDAQEAELRGTGRRVLLAAEPRIDARGRFAGFAGGVMMLDPLPAAAPAPAEDGEPTEPFAAGFGEQLDRSLRRPLERIIANASSMSAGVDGPIAERYSGYADDIASAGRHLLGLVDDLVDLEAVERADFVVDADPLDLADVARRASGLLAVRASEGDVRIDRPAADETLPATGDFRRSLQILVNLIGNAVRYSPRGGSVWVRIMQDDTHACVIVADQGKGIAEADQAMIFEKFGRVDPGEPGGSGLGLYISRRLARAMGGDITVDSAPGAGARFVFTLPLE
ncbi:PAS domain-containing sensor histidine kinase [Sphingomonas sp. Leaf33]|uniref:sensor histidine kinase n=1 Tax=Sphingomonas sp. Leaf33 TaxID=1736215 RepID=UPI0006FBC5D0|nr:HAMP domain-containing sensor histidine kinase [Sphingomonas sp. Leaf33]KQN26440.1 PAS domain-containing sensor histidine kinase [Sphingomonas sp. Leaf33]